MSYLRPGDADRQGGGPAFFYQTAGCISDHGRALLAMHQPEHRHAGQHNARRRGRHHPDGAGAEGVKTYVEKLKAELADTMAMCGAHSLADISRSMLYGF